MEVQVNEVTLVSVPPSNQAEKRCLTVHLDCFPEESWSVYASSNGMSLSSYAPYPGQTRQSLKVRPDASATADEQDPFRHPIKISHYLHHSIIQYGLLEYDWAET